MSTPAKPPSLPRTARGKPGPLVRQFSIFLENRVGRLLDLIRLFERSNIHILGLSVVDTTDSAVIRMIVDDPDKTAELFHEKGLPFNDSNVIAVELPHGPDALMSLLSSLLQAEINMYYTYSLIVRSNDRPVLIFHAEDHELVAEVFKRNGFATLGQADLSR